MSHSNISTGSLCPFYTFPYYNSNVLRHFPYKYLLISINIYKYLLFESSNDLEEVIMDVKSRDRAHIVTSLKWAFSRKKL